MYRNAQMFCILSTKPIVLRWTRMPSFQSVYLKLTISWDCCDVIAKALLSQFVKNETILPFMFHVS